jgi:hypothetical protein
MFDMTASQVKIAAFGRAMMDFSAKNYGAAPLEILNAMSRVGEEIAESASLKNLSATDHMLLRYSKKLMSQ